MSVKEGGAFQTFRDPNGNVLASINRDGSALVQAIDFADGTVQTTAASGGGAVSSVFGRTGAVVAAANDYSAAQLAVGALPNGVTATTQAVGNSTTRVATTAYVLASKFNPTFIAKQSGETNNNSVSLSFTAPNAGGFTQVRFSCYRVILAAASTSFTIGTISTNYTVPLLGVALNFTIPAAALDGSSAAGANIPGAAYAKTFNLLVDPSATVTVTWNGTLSDGGGTFDSYFAMTAEAVATGL